MSEPSDSNSSNSAQGDSVSESVDSSVSESVDSSVNESVDSSVDESVSESVSESDEHSQLSPDARSSGGASVSPLGSARLNVASMADAEPDAELLLSGAPEKILELSLAAARFVHGAVGVAPDLTSDTLPLVDHYLLGARESLEARPELEALITRSVGAYFGEVVRASMRGFWVVPSDDAHEWLLCSSVVFLAINPVGVVYDALFGGVEHSGPSSSLRLDRADAALVEQRLAALPAVRDEDYYLLSTRFDAVEIAVAALRDAAARDGHADAVFEAEDYLPGR